MRLGSLIRKVDDGERRERLFAHAIGNDQRDIEALLDRAGKHGVPGLVIDQPARSPGWSWRWRQNGRSRSPTCPAW